MIKKYLKYILIGGLFLTINNYVNAVNLTNDMDFNNKQITLLKAGIVGTDFDLGNGVYGYDFINSNNVPGSNNGVCIISNQSSDFTFGSRQNPRKISTFWAGHSMTCSKNIRPDGFGDYVLRFGNDVDLNSTVALYLISNISSSCEPCQDCSSIESDLTSCQNQLETCNIGYSSCLDSLESCSSEKECEECPSCDGTGGAEIFINNTPYGNIIKGIIQIPNFIGFETEKNGGLLNINIDGYNQDEEKIQNMVNTQYIQPSNEDFETAIQNIGYFIPILGIFGLIAFFFYLIKKIF